MKLILIRHGETDYNRERRCQGTTDLDLNEVGLKQARAIVKAFERVPLTAVHSSPLKRAMQTAKLLAERANVEIKPEPGLMELNQGEFEGASMDEMMKLRPGVLKEWIAKPADVVLPGGESMRQLEARAWDAVKKIASAYNSKDCVVAVSHNLAISAIVCKALSLDLNLFRKVRLSPAGISRIDFTQFGPVIVSLNNTSHLEEVKD